MKNTISYKPRLSNMKQVLRHGLMLHLLLALMCSFGILAASAQGPDNPLPTAHPQTWDDFKVYQDTMVGVAVFIPENWIVTGIVEGQYAIFQSYPENKYIGGEGLKPGDTKCDLNILSGSLDVDSHVDQLRAAPMTTILSEEEFVLLSGQTATRFEIDNRGRAVTLAVEINSRTVVLTCFGEFEPFDMIASTLHGTEAISVSLPNSGFGFEQYRDAETGIAITIPEHWVVRGIIPGHRATFESFPAESNTNDQLQEPENTLCELFIRRDMRAADFVNQMRNNPVVTIHTEEEIMLNAGHQGTRIEIESMGEFVLLVSDIGEYLVILNCSGDFAAFDDIAVTLTQID